MKKSKKAWIAVAVILIATGIVIYVGTLLTVNFDFTRLNTVSFKTNTYNVEEPFTNISVMAAEGDVKLLPSDDGKCRVVCTEGEKIYHSVAVDNNTLTVERFDSRKWYECIGVYWGKMEITVYLPQYEYETLYIKSVSGNITIPEAFTLGKAEIKNTSGEVSFKSYVKNDLSVNTVSGDLHLSGVNSKNVDVQSTSGEIDLQEITSAEKISVKTVSGSINLSSINAKTYACKSTSGDIVFSNVIAAEGITVKSVSGNIELLSCDGDTLSIKTTSGDVSGSLLTQKIFITETESGDVDVPNTLSGGKCEIKTVSGNIEFN